jgi:hypothetical protein
MGLDLEKRVIKRHVGALVVVDDTLVARPRTVDVHPNALAWNQLEGRPDFEGDERGSGGVMNLPMHPVLSQSPFFCYVFQDLSFRLRVNKWCFVENNDRHVT